MTSGVTVSITVERGEEEFEVKCEFKVWPGAKGHRDKYGCPEEPDTPPELELLAARDEWNNEIELSELETERAEERAWEVAHEQNAPQED